MSALIFIIYGAVSASATGSTFTVDTSASPAQLNFPILDCVGSGHGALALRSDYRQQLANVQRDIGFKHIRGHGLLDDDMSSYICYWTEHHSEEICFTSWTNIFSVFDFYLSLNIRPIFEISGMPNFLAWNQQSPSHVMWYRFGNQMPGNDTRWSGFIQDLFTNLISRYGAEEIRSWRVEVWNEPAGPCGFFCPRPGFNQYSGYVQLYNITANAIKAVDKGISVGGPATAGLAWVPQFLGSVGNGTMLPTDFISTHSYPTDYGPSLTRTQFEDAIISLAKTVEDAGLPLVITEMAAGLGNQFDAPYAASFLTHIAGAFLGVKNVPTLSYWTFSDIFEEGGFWPSPWINTYGLQTKYGIPKPAYRAFQLISRFPAAWGVPVLGEGAAPKRPGPAANCTATIGTLDVIAAADASLGTTVSLHALVTNFNANPNDALNSSTGQPITTEVGVTIVFSNLPHGAQLPANATITLLDSKNGWARPVWVAAGSPLYPSKEELEAELAASQPATLSVPIVVSQGAASVTLPDLEPYAVALVVLEYGLG